jgi:hypothetical protein
LHEIYSSIILPKVKYEDDHVTIVATLLPKPPERRAIKIRAIALFPPEGQIGNDSESIIRALKTKAMRYGKLILLILFV